ncbi:Protein of uncharacterised function DUF72 [Bordetella pertussis]|nr:Protein of uncharacterised function DUF72 [Bordetella pertussis]
MARVRDCAARLRDAGGLVMAAEMRHASAWNNRAAASSSRFQYEYSPQELAELAERVRRLAERARQTHAVFNTNYEDQGMRNAAGLAAALAP